MGRLEEKNMSMGIQSRIISNFGIVILLLVTIIELILIIVISNYYIGGVEQILKDRVTITAEFLNSDNSYFSTEEKARSLFQRSKSTYEDKFLVQFIDNNKNLILDSNGFSDNIEINTADVNAAFENKIVLHRSVNSSTGENMLAASRPLFRYSRVDGVIRFVISLEDVEVQIQKFISLSIVIGLFIIAIFIIISIFISNTIVYPIKQLNETAKCYARGNFDIKAEKNYDDEVGVLADTMNFMAGEIKNSEQIKNEFISSISHELRTPLTSIKGWSETLQTSEVYSKDSDLAIGLNIISSEAFRLQNMVEELLDFSRYQAGNLKIQKRVINLKEVITEVYKQFSNKRTNLELICDLKGEDTLIFGDRDRLKQVYINLVSNAIKFTPDDGKVELIVTGYADRLETAVIDNGVGINKEDLPKITKKFFKGSNSVQGSGIGLSIVSEIIKIHDGKLEIESEIGEGSIFRIIYPAYVENIEDNE